MPDGPATAEQRTRWIASIETLPERLRTAAQGLTPGYLSAAKAAAARRTE